MRTYEQKLKLQITAIVQALHEAGTDAAESTFYLALGMDMANWTDLRGLLIASDLITVKHHRVALTAKGTALAVDINNILAGAK